MVVFAESSFKISKRVTPILHAVRLQADSDSAPLKRVICELIPFAREKSVLQKNVFISPSSKKSGIKSTQIA
jgi:hypothetical protein